MEGLDVFFCFQVDGLITGGWGGDVGAYKLRGVMSSVVR